MEHLFKAGSPTTGSCFSVLGEMVVLELPERTGKEIGLFPDPDDVDSGVSIFLFFTFYEE